MMVHNERSTDQKINTGQKRIITTYLTEICRLFMSFSWCKAVCSFSSFNYKIKTSGNSAYVMCVFL